MDFDESPIFGDSVSNVYEYKCKAVRKLVGKMFSYTLKYVLR